jgi:hypothetical protein
MIMAGPADEGNEAALLAAKVQTPTKSATMTAQLRETAPQPQVGKQAAGSVAVARDWEAAWSAAETKARELIQAQRFGETEATYRGLRDSGKGVSTDPLLAARIDKAIQDVQAQSEAAYQAIAARAKQLLAEKKFAEARQALAAVVDGFGVAAHEEAARTLLSAIAAEESQAQAAAAQAAVAAQQAVADRQAELERQQEIQRQRERERRYAQALAPADEKLAA